MYRYFFKRVLDFAVALSGLYILFPFFVLIAICIKIDTKGPVFYRQERVGKQFKHFRLFKFRSMVVDADKKGLGITAKGDARITIMGRFLRRTKIDELPQLINVLLGDMSLVGPRPEIPKYVEMAYDDFKELLRVRPGITDPATLEYRYEEEVLAEFEDKEKGYIEQVLPEKIKLSKSYLEKITFISDLRLILRTVIVSFFR
ncbi:MAG: sugar transferase [bacterium]|nr:sugar transferase [bacterium]